MADWWSGDGFSELGHAHRVGGQGLWTDRGGTCVAGTRAVAADPRGLPANCCNAGFDVFVELGRAIEVALRVWLRLMVGHSLPTNPRLVTA